MEQPNYYAVIPANVRYDKRLGANEKLLYGEITTLTIKTGECWASNNYFAELYDCTPQAISKWVGKLEKCGYIKTEITYKKDSKEIEKRTICLTSAEVHKVSTDIDRVSTYDCGGINTGLIGYQHTIKEKNTSISNTRLIKEKVSKDTSKKDDKIHFAEFVVMTNAEYEKLVSTYGKNFADQCIEVLDNYKGSSGKKYKSDYRAILTWVVQRVKEDNQRSKVNVQRTARGARFEDFLRGDLSDEEGNDTNTDNSSSVVYEVLPEHDRE